VGTVHAACVHAGSVSHLESMQTTACCFHGATRVRKYWDRVCCAVTWRTIISWLCSCTGGFAGALVLLCHPAPPSAQPRQQHQCQHHAGHCRDSSNLMSAARCSCKLYLTYHAGLDHCATVHACTQLTQNRGEQRAAMLCCWQLCMLCNARCAWLRSLPCVCRDAIRCCC
jgi:hypothetical protein